MPPLWWGDRLAACPHKCKRFATKPTQQPRITKRKQRQRQRTSKTDNDLRIGSWNITSLHRAGALRTVVDQLNKYRVDIAAVQEVRWPGNGSCDVRGSTLYYCGGNGNRHEHGTGFIVRGRMKEKVIGFKAANERMCMLRIKARMFNIAVVCVYAPTEEKDEETKEEFYEQLELLMDGIPKADVKIVLGDFNAKIGREEAFSPTIGRNSLHETSNDNGIRTVNFAAARNLVVSSTWFPHKSIHKATWISPDGATRNQIDHMLVEGRHFSSVMDVRTSRGADCDTDHMLVIGKYRARISNMNKERSKRATKWNTGRLNNPEVKLRYENALVDRFTEQNQEEEASVEQLWNQIKGNILTTVEEVVGVEPRNREQEWFDEEYANALEIRRVAREKYLQ